MDIKRYAASLKNAAKRITGYFSGTRRDKNPSTAEQTIERAVPTAKILALYAQIWLYQIIGLLIFGIGRFVFLYCHTSHDERMENIDYLPMFLYNSLRFDLQAVSYIATPMILAALAISFIKSEKSIRRMRRTMQWYFTTMLTFITLLVIGEFYYYDNFETRYNIVFFDFLDEGPAGLLKTMWDDYPLFSILLCVTGIGALIYQISKYISRLRIKNRKWMGKLTATATTMLIPALTFVFIRGSVGIYPLQVEAFEVSPNANINEAVPNTLYLLDKAYTERANSFELKSDAEVLAEEGFCSIEEVIAESLLNQNNDKDYSNVEKALFNIMSRPDEYGFKQPNVLIIMNESWSTFLLGMDKGEKLDLLCSLRPHLQEDLLMENIQSVQDGTIYSIESTILAMPFPHFFKSCYRFNSLKTSMAYPFLRSGYNTRFICGADPTWENLSEALKVQYFEKVDGRQQILHAIPGSSTSQIGAYDEYLYTYILNEMMEAQKSGKPQFFMALTTTNHPPFEYPKEMNLPPLTVEWYNSKFIKGKGSVKTKYGLGAQYSSRCLGDFMTALKQSELAGNTIVIAIGDHNVRSILDYDNVPAEYKHRVPMYIYLPPQYALTAEAKERISKRFGCHFDILPTIARYAFKDGVEYLNIGQDLFDMEKDDDEFFSYNVNKILTSKKERTTEFGRIMEARITLIKLYYQRIFRGSTN